MQFKTLSVFAAAAGLASAMGANHVVEVGNGGLTFNPNNINASMGDTVTFKFFPKNHNVVQSTFATPCRPMTGGFYSGFHATASGEANETFTITVADTKPIWVYCSQASHCQSGMVAVINENPTSPNSLTAFIAAAKTATNNTTPSVTPGTGGVIMANTNTPAGSNNTAGNAAPALLSSSGAQLASLLALGAGMTLFF